MESLLKLQSGQTAILGGLMKDEAAVNTQGVPWLSQIFPIGEVFKHRNNEFTKSELVIFLRPKVISNPSLNADLKDYKQFLNPTPDLDVVSPIQSENR
jgi:general secretion pathway protein D